jgi:hypothetical protein
VLLALSLLIKWKVGKLTGSAKRATDHTYRSRQKQAFSHQAAPSGLHVRMWYVTRSTKQGEAVPNVQLGCMNGPWLENRQTEAMQLTSVTMAENIDVDGY